MLDLASTNSHMWLGPTLLKEVVTTKTYLQEAPPTTSNNDISFKSYMIVSNKTRVHFVELSHPLSIDNKIAS